MFPILQGNIHLKANYIINQLKIATMLGNRAEFFQSPNFNRPRKKRISSVPF
jgi:hypothetical protein